MDLSEESVSQEPKIGEGVKGSRLQSLDLFKKGVIQEPKIQTPEIGSVQTGREPGARERGRECRDPDSRVWICLKRA